MKAWYFSDATKKLQYNDGRDIAIDITHTVEGTPKCCRHGLHGSKNILDALQCAPGNIIWRVELSGKMDRQPDKISATSRTYLAGGVDILPIILAWSRRVALDVAHLWDMPDIVRKFLETGDKEIANATVYAAYVIANTANAANATYSAANAANAAANAANTANAAYAAYSAYVTARAAANAAAYAAVNAANAAAKKKYTRWLLQDINKAMEGTK